MKFKKLIISTALCFTLLQTSYAETSAELKAKATELKKEAKGLGDKAFPDKFGMGGMGGLRVIDISNLIQQDPDKAPNFSQQDEDE